MAVSAQWMWADASLVGHQLAERNPLRWSCKKSIEATIDDLLRFSQRKDGLKLCLNSEEAVNHREDTKRRFRKRGVLANVPSGFWYQGKSEYTLVPVLVPGEHPHVPSFRFWYRGTSAKTTLLETTILRALEIINCEDLPWRSPG